MTLTREKFALYQRFGGELDARTRAVPDTRTLLSDEEWAMIDDLHMQIAVVRAGRASEAFATTVQQRLDAVADADLRAALWGSALP
ncbi:hypothetical protein [Methyloversatilis discipulorum]|uniref:hypothetical protein n=1 Tax=Methyloversatilis discipulorum TaxID=1119528 RepID=UPI003F3CABB2